MFTGETPPELVFLSSLQVFDLADNKLSGSIPSSIGNLKASMQTQRSNHYLLYGRYRGVYYEESLFVSMKGESLEYNRTLSLVTSIDLSRNGLTGEIPEDLLNLRGLLVLNLSGNLLTGKLPEKITYLRGLMSLDVSENGLSGVIPPGMVRLTSLSYLNLSFNNFSGEVPSGGQLTTFEESSFAENPNLCVPWVQITCKFNVPSNHPIGEQETVENPWFGLSVDLGFGFGFLGVYVVLLIRRPWSDAYFRFMDKVIGLCCRK
ncbi:hypothetical protein AMTRI_Chr11g154030 [Amborella trichopoda]